MTRVISFVNLKGGVAKSTTTVTLAETLASAFLKKVLVIDLDPQGAATAMLCGAERMVRLMDEEHRTLLELMRIVNPNNAKDYVDKAVSDIVLQSGSSLDILPSHSEMVRYSEGTFKSGRAPDLSKGDATLYYKLGSLLEQYEYVLIDCPPSIGRLTRFGLWFSDFYIIPTIPDFLSSRMFYDTVKQIEEYKEYIIKEGDVQPKACRFAGVIITKYQTQIATHDRTIQVIKDSFALPLVDKVTVFHPFIRQSVELVRPFEEQPAKSDGTSGKRPTEPPEYRLKKIHASYKSKYKAGIDADLCCLAEAIQAL